MRLFASFILSIFIYSGLLFFFILIIQQNNSEKPKIVYVHQVITNNKIAKIEKKQPNNIQKIIKKKVEEKIKTPKKIENKTKDDFSKGGEYKIDDLFSNVDDNIPTTPIRKKQKKNITKKKGNTISNEVKKVLQKLKTNMTVSNIKGDTKDTEYIQNELSKVWSQINTDVNDFVKIKINITNGNINVVVISTNLDTIRLNQFLSKIKLVNTTKTGNIDAIIEFKSELKD